MTHILKRLNEKPCPVVFKFIPQAVAVSGEVPGPSLYEKAILYLSLKQEVVKDFILPEICNIFIFSDFIKIFILFVWFLIIRTPLKNMQM